MIGKMRGMMKAAKGAVTKARAAKSEKKMQAGGGRHAELNPPGRGLFSGGVDKTATKKSPSPKAGGAPKKTSASRAMKKVVGKVGVIGAALARKTGKTSTSGRGGFSRGK